MRHHRVSIRSCTMMSAQPSQVSTAPVHTQAHRLTSTKFACDQGQAAASRGRRRETPADPRPSACASVTHPGYFGDARHDRTIGVRPLPRSAPENVVRKLLVGDGEQPKNVCVVSGRRSRATRQQEHAPSRTCWITRFKKIRGGLGRLLRREPENLRRATQRAMSAEKRMPSSEGRGRRRKAPSTHPARPRRCLPSYPHSLRPSDARSAAAAPRAPPHGRGKGRHHHTGAPAGARRHAAVAAPARALP
jgi:hypothetical protein